MKTLNVALSISILFSGCTASRLRDSTIRQARTLTDLQYQQVLDNVAAFTANPDILPWHVNLKNGVSQVQDTGQASLNFFLQGQSMPQVNLNGSRSIVEQWSNVPLTDDTMLKLLQAAYQNAVGIPHFLSQEEADELAHDLSYQTGTNADISIDRYTLDNLLSSLPASAPSSPSSRPKDTIPPSGPKDTIPPSGLEDTIRKKLLNAYAEREGDISQTMDDHIISQTGMKDGRFRPDKDFASGLVREVVRQVNDVQKELISIAELGTDWYGRGSRKDVPHNATYVAHFGDHYVWVLESNLGELSRLTLSVLHIASLLRDIQVVNAPSGVQFSPTVNRPSPVSLGGGSSK
jgi:hypothetical protein